MGTFCQLALDLVSKYLWSLWIFWGGFVCGAVYFAEECKRKMIGLLAFVQFWFLLLVFPNDISPRHEADRSAECHTK